MDAIERRYLASMKLIVFLDQARPDKFVLVLWSSHTHLPLKLSHSIVEAYTLSFHYPDADSPPTLSMDQAVQRLSVSAATKKTSRSLELGVAQTESQVIRSIKVRKHQRGRCANGIRTCSRQPSRRLRVSPIFRIPATST